jgi:hypothetical protein
MAKPSPRKKLIKECDDLWAKIVKARDGKCMICGRDGCLQAHHCHVRQYLATRHDPENGVSLCRGCHYRGHMEPERFRDQIIAIIGEEKYLQLKEKSRFYGKPFKITVKDLEDRREWLIAEWARRQG